MYYLLFHIFVWLALQKPTPEPTQLSFHPRFTNPPIVFKAGMDAVLEEVIHLMDAEPDNVAPTQEIRKTGTSQGGPPRIVINVGMVRL